MTPTMLTIKRYMPGDTMKIANYKSVNKSIKRWAIVTYKENRVIIVGSYPAVYDKLYLAQRALAKINEAARHA